MAFGLPIKKALDTPLPHSYGKVGQTSCLLTMASEVSRQKQLLANDGERSEPEILSYTGNYYFGPAKIVTPLF